MIVLVPSYCLSFTLIDNHICKLDLHRLTMSKNGKAYKAYRGFK